MTTGHLAKTLTLPSTTFKMAFSLTIVSISVTLTHEKSLSSKFVRPFLQSDHHLPSRQTPNPILDPTDVPERCQRNVHPGPIVSYPTDSRYTLQWIVTPSGYVLDNFPNNNDAKFVNHQLPKPADVLLHYNYGVAAVKQWGKNTSVLTNRPEVPRPPVPAPVAMGPIRSEALCCYETRRTGFWE